MPYRVVSTRPAQQDTTQTTQAFAPMMGTPRPPTSGNPGGGEGLASSYGLGGDNPNATQSYVSGSLAQPYASPMRRPGQPFGGS